MSGRSAEELAALHARCFDAAPRPWTTQEFTDMLAAPGMVFVEDDQGFALARLIASEAELLTIAVAPEGRRRGVGRGLLTECEAGAARAGATRMFLEVAKDNPAAVALYGSAGYTSAGYRKDYYRSDGRRTSALVMAKPLQE